MESFELIDEFDCSPDRLWDILETDEKFRRRLDEATEVRREIVEEDLEGDFEFRRIRCVSMREIPGLMQKALGIERLEYELEHRLDRDDGVMKWVLSTPFLTERVEAGGNTRVEETDQGCRRTVEGQVEIGLPMVGAKMEKKLVDRLRDSDQKGAQIAREILAEEE